MSEFLVKPHQKIKYTPEKIEDLQKCMDPETGPAYFMEKFLYVQHPTRGSIKFKPYDFQKDLINVYHNYRKSIALVSRQMGKSTVAAGYLLWYAMFKENSLIILASRTLDDALEIMEKIKHAYESLPDYIKPGVQVYNRKTIRFDNNSRIIAESTTENTGRGKSASLIYLDEFAFVDVKIANSLWRSLSPTLSTGGKIIITSTPNTDEDKFAVLWQDANTFEDEYGNRITEDVGINGFKAYKAIWSEHPERDEAWKREQIKDLGLEGFKREHMCEFIAFDETLIKGSKLLELNKDIKEPIRTNLYNVRFFKEIDPTKTYVIGLDPSLGTGGHNAAIEVFELPSAEQVAEWKHNETLIEDQIKILRELLKEFEEKGAEDVYWSLENNSLGEAALAAIRALGEGTFHGMFVHGKDKSGVINRKGFRTSSSSKINTCTKLKFLVENDILKIHSSSLLTELKNFVYNNGTFKCKKSIGDDLISATLIALRVAEYIAKWDDEIFKVLNTDKNESFGALPVL